MNEYEHDDDELLIGDENSPSCAHCGHQCDSWKAGKEYHAKVRICPACRKKNLVWHYKVFVVRRKTNEKANRKTSRVRSRI
jgi:NAD-dependent SIR2 family protein deacetylase